MTSKALLSILLALAMTAAACGSSANTGDDAGSAPESTSAVTDPPSAPDPTGGGNDADLEDTGAFVDRAQDTIERIAPGYDGVAGVWKGYDPADHPVVLAVRDDADQVIGAVAINHPAPDALGAATALDIAGLPFTSAHAVTALTDHDALQGVDPFDFAIELGGVDSFAMIAGGSDEFFDTTDLDYVSTLLHELFHRHQIKTFAVGDVGQDVEGYAYTPENLELAVLEERALLAALGAGSEAEMEMAARHFVALRSARLEADPRVALDGSQEIGEGTARWIEHAFASADSGHRYHDGNVGEDLLTDLERSGGIKEWFGFGRFYSTGAAIIELLHRLDVADIESRIGANQSPAELLTEHLGVEPGDVPDLVAAARAAHDPEGELAEAAVAAAERAADEPPVFDDLPGDATTGDAEVPEDGTVITANEMACLEENGITPGAAISDELFEQCLG